MNPQEHTSSTSPQSPEIHNPLSVMQPGEKVICEIHRHPAGVLGLYVIAGTLLVALAVLMLVVVPNVFAANRSSAMAASTVLFLVVASAVVGFVFIANKIYWGNRWILTSDSLTQISQTSLFNKQSSQLSLANLEDVTSGQYSMPAQLLKYGTLRVETAGERSKFTFPYCPTPDYYAQKILAAREAFERTHPAAGHAMPAQSNHPDSPYQPAPQPQPPAPVQPVQTATPPVFPDVPYDNRQQGPYS